MILREGEKVHVMIRRRFDGDLRRHFIGLVTDVEGTLARVDGYVFVFESSLNRYHRRDDRRTRILSLSDAGNIINILPSGSDIEAAYYTASDDGHLVVTDGRAFSLDINEFGHSQ